MLNYMAYLLVLLAAILWGTTGTAQSFFQGAVHPLSIGAFRLAIGGFSLLLFVIVARKLSVRTIPWPATILAAISMALFQPLFFSSVQMTGIAIGTVVTIGSAPVLTGLIEWIALNRKPDRIWGSATLLALTGCVLLFANKGQQLVDPVGIAMALGAGFSFAVYALVSKSVLKAMETVSAVAVIFSLSACCLLPFLLLFDVSYITVPLNFSLIIYLGIGATSLSYLLFSFGLKQIPSSSAVTLSLAEPLTAAVLGVAVVGEVLSGLSWLGVGLLLCGILILTIGDRRGVPAS